ncbi:hypothetical protein PG999_011197 [Apiospora kogelbergensis]|uniref:MYND-type domain-containing protein n=1 Tax=Apiospora kogelbergensis TaxID=1337665 RepID=A0AAW0QHY5_9PEZI
MNRKNLGLVFQTCAQPGCGRQGPDLFRCGACRLVHYCGPEHQREHRASHKTSCNLVKQTRASVEAAEAELRSRPEDELAPANVFANGVGRFWGLTPTRPYMQCLHDYMTASLNLRTGEAVEGGSNHVPRDAAAVPRRQPGRAEPGTRAVPTTGPRPGGLRLSEMVRRQGHRRRLRLVRHVAAVPGPRGGRRRPRGRVGTLQAGHGPQLPCVSDAAQDAADAGPGGTGAARSRGGKEDGGGGEPGRKLSYEEKMAWLREEALSDILPARRDIVDRDDYRPLVRDVTEQVARAHQLTAHHNKHYWPSLERPEKYANAMPMAYSWGSREETVLAFRQTW